MWTRISKENEFFSLISKASFGLRVKFMDLFKIHHLACKNNIKIHGLSSQRHLISPPIVIEETDCFSNCSGNHK